MFPHNSTISICILGWRAQLEGALSWSHRLSSGREKQEENLEGHYQKQTQVCSCIYLLCFLERGAGWVSGVAAVRRPQTPDLIEGSSLCG